MTDGRGLIFIFRERRFSRRGSILSPLPRSSTASTAVVANVSPRRIFLPIPRDSDCREPRARNISLATIHYWLNYGTLEKLFRGATCPGKLHDEAGARVRDASRLVNSIELQLFDAAEEMYFASTESRGNGERGNESIIRKLRSANDFQASNRRLLITASYLVPRAELPEPRRFAVLREIAGK